MYGNGRPLTKKQLVRLTLGLTILAWATQTLFAQWGFGAELTTNAPIAIHESAAGTTPAAAVGGGTPAVAPRSAPATGERFISARPLMPAGGTLEIRPEARVFGAEVRLKQIARWNERDSAFFEQAAELVITRLDGRTPYRVIDIELVRQVLLDAKVNIGLVRFAGTMSCNVSRSDAKPDPDAALAKWIDAKEQAVLFQDAPAGVPAATRPTAPSPSALTTSDAVTAVRTLRDVITDDLASRLNLPVDQLQLAFNGKDERLLNLCEPQFRFSLEGQRIRNLGDVTWTVTITSGDKSQKAIVTANARAWQWQATVARPVSARAPIMAADLEERRVLLDRLPEETPIRAEQAIGQQASRDLKPGMTLTGRMVESLPMVRNGQLVTVTSKQGAIRLKTVVRAMETGARGQRVRVKNEATNEMFDVVLTGPQEAEMGV